MQPHVQDKQKEVANKKGLFLQVNFSLFHQSPLWFSFYHYWFLSYLSWPFYTLFQNELREGSNEDEDDDEDEFNHVQDRHAEYSSNGHQIQLHITSDSQDEEHPTYTNLTNADNDTNDANESHYRRSYEWKRKQPWSIFCQILIVITICSNCIISLKRKQVLWKIHKCVCKLTTWWPLSKLKWYEGKILVYHDCHDPQKRH